MHFNYIIKGMIICSVWTSRHKVSCSTNDFTRNNFSVTELK